MTEVTGPLPQPSGPDDEEALQLAAASRLQAEMEAALRHLRERASEWQIPGVREPAREEPRAGGECRLGPRTEP